MVAYQAAVPAVAVDCRPRQPDTRRGNGHRSQVGRASPGGFAVSRYCFLIETYQKITHTQKNNIKTIDIWSQNKIKSKMFSYLMARHYSNFIFYRQDRMADPFRRSSPP